MKIIFSYILIINSSLILFSQQDSVITPKSLFSDTTIKYELPKKKFKIYNYSISYNFLGFIYGQQKISISKQFKKNSIQITGGLTKKDYLIPSSNQFYRYESDIFGGGFSHNPQSGYLYEIEYKRFQDKTLLKAYLSISYSHALYKSEAYELVQNESPERYSSTFNLNKRFNDNLTLNLGYVTLTPYNQVYLDWYVGFGIRKINEEIYSQESIGSYQTVYHSNKEIYYKPIFNFGARVGLYFIKKKK